MSATALPAEAPAQVPVVTIRPSRGWSALKLGEVWQYRELLYFLTWREVKVRYKQTFFGAAWAILQPLLTMVVFTVFFGKLAGISSEGVPYPIFSYAGLLPWTLFSDGLGKAAASLVGSSNLLTKVYFPRLVLPCSSVLSALVDFAVAFALLLGLMLFYGIWPSASVLLVPLLVIYAMAVALAIGLWVSALNVQYRDVRYVIPFFIQIWLFVSPVIYPASRATTKMAERGIPVWIYGLNPMAGVVEGFRWALLPHYSNPAPLIGTGLLVTAVLLTGGAYYFRRLERTFADVI